MKYLYIIFAIIGLASIFTLFLILPGKKPAQQDIAITINGHDFAKNTVAAESSKFGYHTDQQVEIFDTLITREVLIQEAERQEIQKEESFRTALKNYYENSLIKTLLDRQNSTIHATASDEDIDNYIKLLGSIVTYTRLDSIPKTVEEAASAKGLANTVSFTELAIPVRILLSSLQPSQFGINFDTGNESYALRLDNVKPSLDSNGKPADRKRIKEMIEEYKKEQQINRWILGLRQKAKITIHNNQ